MMDENRGLHWFAVTVAASTLMLIFIGGLVTSTGSGLSVPDWPLSYGRLFPPMVGGVLYEHGHRIVATVVGVLTVVLAVWLWRREPRRWVRRLGGLALLTVVAQGVLGGVTVLLKLPVAVSVGHAALAQLFFALTVSIALFTSRGWQHERRRTEDRGKPSIRRLALATTAAIYGQMLIGAWMRHTWSGLAIPDFPLSFGHLVPPLFTAQILVNYAHRVGAAVVSGTVVWLVGAVLHRHGSEATLRTPCLTLAAALVVQIYLGAETIWSIRATVPTTAHVMVGAFCLAMSVVTTLSAYRVLAPRSSPEAVLAPQAGTASE